MMRLRAPLLCGRAVLLLLVFAMLSCGGSGGGGESGNLSAERDALALDLAQLIDPPARFGPWVRWWWPGNDVQVEELQREVGVLVDAGFAGAEIQAFDAALDPAVDAERLARRRSFDSPSYYEHLVATLEAARERGLEIDLNLGSGWATGGAHVPVDGSLGSLFTREHLLDGPVVAKLDLSVPEAPIFYGVSGLLAGLFDGPLARWLPEHAERIAVLAARVVGGGRNGNALVLTDRLDLDPGSVVNLTELVNADGSLDIELPEGSWVVVAFFHGPDGEFPQLSAEAEPAYVVDLLDAAAVEANLEHLLGARTGLERFFGTPLRGFFHDSLELRVERHFARDLLAEFESRRGYDLSPWLPTLVVPGADNVIFESAGLVRRPAYGLTDLDERIRYDHVRTVSELYGERYGQTSSRWAAARGLTSRMQAYGANLDPLLVAGSADIPESEQLFGGGSDLFLETVSSGAMLYGRDIVSAEAMVWLSRDGMSTPAKMKAAADKAFAAGVNQLVVHGFPYRDLSPAYGETGWQPFSSPFGGSGGASSQVNEASPFWADMPALNRYFARVQRALRSGRREIDVLVYYPWLGFPSTLIGLDLEEPLFNGVWPGEPEVGLVSLIQIGSLFGLTEIDPRAHWLVDRRPALEALRSEGGWDWGWINDDRLAVAHPEGPTDVGPPGLLVGDQRFDAIVVAEVDRMRPEAAEALARLAEQGVPVVLAGTMPDRQPGFGDRERGDSRVRDAMRRVREAPSVGVLVSSDGLVPTLGALGVSPAITGDANIPGFVTERRRLADGSRVIFISNPGEQILEGVVGLHGCSVSHQMNPWSGRLFGPYAGALTVRLEAHGSTLLLCDLPREALAGIQVEPPEAALPAEGFIVHALDRWTLSVQGTDVRGGSFSADLEAPLPDWRELPELRLSSSRGRYVATVQLSEQELARVTSAEIRVATVHGAAEVRVNGGVAGRVSVPPYVVHVTELLVVGENLIEIDVVPTLRNRYVGFAAAGDPAYTQYLGEQDTLLPNGMQGVSLILR